MALSYPHSWIRWMLPFESLGVFNCIPVFCSHRLDFSQFDGSKYHQGIKHGWEIHIYIFDHIRQNHHLQMPTYQIFTQLFFLIFSKTGGKTTSRWAEDSDFQWFSYLNYNLPFMIYRCSIRGFPLQQHTTPPRAPCSCRPPTAQRAPQRCHEGCGSWCLWGPGWLASTLPVSKANTAHGGSLVLSVLYTINECYYVIAIY